MGTPTDFHAHQAVRAHPDSAEPAFGYTFESHFHPYVGAFLERLGRSSVDGLLHLDTQRLREDFFQALYDPTAEFGEIDVGYGPKEVELGDGGAYSAYNWELFFHLPHLVAVLLSSQQRFAEAQRWFHFIFDPTSTDATHPPHLRYWKFRAFRDAGGARRLEDLLLLLARPKDECTPEERVLRQRVIDGYEALRDRPFQPYVVARTRWVAFRKAVVMGYLDNLIAWGDSLYRQDTRESVAEATQLFVLAANLLGPRPQRIPPHGHTPPRTFAQLRAGLDRTANALSEMEGLFPFDPYLPRTEGVDTDRADPLFGIARTLYFCVPHNEKLLGYWDTVADRLFKIRHCMNIEGVVRQLALFDPPIDPGMLVKAAAAGIDVGRLVSGLDAPLSPVRALPLIRAALELCNELRAMGAALLSALEKHDGEAMSLLRQEHEVNLLERTRDVRFLHWREAREATEGLLRTRALSVERYRFSQRLLGKPEAETAGLAALALERRELTAENFDGVYQELVGQYAAAPRPEAFPPLRLAEESSLHLSVNEDLELNVHLPSARRLQEAAARVDSTAATLGLLPNVGADAHYLGLGAHTQFGGPALAQVALIGAGLTRSQADGETFAGAQAGRTAGYERRLDEWILQNNLAALELAQIGRQIVAALIREQIARHEYESHLRQIEQAREVDRFLHEKVTRRELYGWMQGELSRLYHEYYKLAFDAARRAEQTMKHELMRPELDGTTFVKFGDWDGGWRELLSGETLHLALVRVEAAYHEHDRREYELTENVSLRRLDPVALLALKATGSCEFTLPEWFFDQRCPGHYLRRIRSVALSIPAVTGPYTGVHCTLSLLRSTVRRSPRLEPGEQGYARGPGDDRFVDYLGTVQAMVTSTGSNDTGMFETSLRDERFLPFEGAGSVSTWRLELPATLRQFDYDTISDVVLHLRYTARPADPLREAAEAEVERVMGTRDGSGLAVLLDLRHDFPSEWHLFAGGSEDLKVKVRREHFPYLVHDRSLRIDEVRVFAVRPGLPSVSRGSVEATVVPTALGRGGGLELTLPDDTVLVRDGTTPVFALLRYSIITEGTSGQAPAVLTRLV